MRRKIKFNINFSKFFEGEVKPGNTSFEIEIEETPANYKFLCSDTIGIENWCFSEENDESKDEYLNIKEKFEKYDINMKDLRDIIMIAYSFYKLPGSDIDNIIYYFLNNKNTLKEKVYSENLIVSTISALSKTTDPLKDFLSRLKKVDAKKFSTFDEYYLTLYGIDK